MSLSPDFKVTTAELQDIPLRVAHHLHGAAPSILRYLQPGIVYSAFKQRTQESGISQQTLTELLGFLNTVGALGVRRNSWGAFQAAVAQLGTFLQTGVRYPHLTERRTFSTRQLARSIVRTCAGLIAASLIVGGFFSGATGTSFSTAILVILGGLATLIWSTFIHEYAHYVVLAQDNIPAVIMRRGMRLGLIHPIRGLLPDTELRSALAGPITGACFSLLVLSLAITYNASWLAAISAVIVVIHLSGLLPWFGDGQTIARLQSKRRYHESKQ